MVSVGFLPPDQQLDVSLRQLVVASPQDHQVPEEALRTPVAIPSVNCCCAGQVQQCSHEHDRTFQQFRRVFLEVQAQSGPVLHDHCRQHRRQVFLGNQVQASEHRAIVLAQVRPHLVFILEIEMAVKAIQAHHSHDPCLDRNLEILAQPPGPVARVP